MKTITLKLCTKDNNINIIELKNMKLDETRIFLKTVSKEIVYSDKEYYIEFANDNNFERIELYINNEEIPILYFDGRINFANRVDNGKIFNNFFGHVNIKIKLFEGTDIVEYISEHLPVLIPDEKDFGPIFRMAKYIDEHNSEFLYRKCNSTINEVDFNTIGEKKINTQIRILNEITKRYEQNFPYFKINSRFEINNKPVISAFNKAHRIDRNMIRYIVTHPSELKEISERKGIKIGDKLYMPRNTLISEGTYTYNTYENKIVVNFLFSLDRGVSLLEKEIDEIIESLPVKEKTMHGYIYSNYFIASHTLQSLEKNKTELKKISEKIRQLYGMYSRILKVDREEINRIPKPTKIMLSLQHYREIFGSIVNWFQHNNYNVEEEKMKLTFLKYDVMYESYVLVKLIRYFANRGYKLIETKKEEYFVGNKAKYKNTETNNTFVFIKNSKKLTLYYQPVINAGNKKETNGIGLFRNNTYSIDGYDGFYYTPDYIIKIENENENMYIIADAKYSEKAVVLREELHELVYKYLFSISTFNIKDKVVSLEIINGKPLGADKVSSVFDLVPNDTDIKKSVNITTIIEKEMENESRHEKLFDEIFNKWLEYSEVEK